MSSYLVIVDLDTGEFEAVTSPDAGKRGAGMQTVVLALSKDVKAVLTGYCSPTARSHLTANGIDVCTGVTGTVGEAFERYKRGDFQKSLESEPRAPGDGTEPKPVSFARALRNSLRQFATLFPVMVSVVLLVGLLNAFVSRSLLASILSGNAALDTIWGACFGSILAGNPINSYIIGTAFMLFSLQCCLIG